MRDLTMAGADLTFNVTEFKAKSLKLFDQLSRGEIGRITVTKRGRPVATVSAAPPDAKLRVKDLYGRLRGTVSIPPGVDITEPVIHPEWEEEMLRDWDEQNS